MKNFKFTINGIRYDVDVLSLEGNIARIEVNGTSYQVEIHKELKQAKTPVIVRSPVKEPQKDIEKRSGGPRTEVRSPLPGIITGIFVSPGEEVRKGQKLFSLEAMKMENEISAERDGLIAAVRVVKGQTVLQEEVIIEMN